jgi:SAM-dependent methyltransferase
MPESIYPGSELELFARASNWKKYFAQHLRPHLIGDVLEVGAGLGGTTPFLNDGRQRRWVCLEPDRTLAQQAANDPGVEWRYGTLDDVPEGERFDCILYLDVLEHIEDDRREVERASQHLSHGGALIVLAPAHQYLYSPFDRKIGHFRRYNLQMLRQLTPPTVRMEKLIYLDAAGLLASGANRLLLRSSDPTPTQILFWDRVLVSISRRLDPLLRYAIGKSALAVWRKL